MMKTLGIIEKAHTAFLSAGYDALLITGADNTGFLSGAQLPFMKYRRGQAMFLFWKKTAEPVSVCPAEWETCVRETSWVPRLEPYDTACNGQQNAVNRLQHLGTDLPDHARVGIDMDQVSVGLLAALQAALPGLDWQDCSGWLRDLRMIKTSEEVNLLEQAAELTDHGLNGAIHHVTIDRRTTSLTLAEELRVHTEERGVDLVGYYAASHVVAGKDTALFWANPPAYGYSRTEDLHPEEMVRMKIQTCLSGYWADATRIMVMGEPSPAQARSYDQLVTLRETALASIKPGIPCNQVYAAVREAASQAKIDLFPGSEVGHGIGVQPCEPPYLNPRDHTPLAAGMVLVIDPIIRDEEGQIWRSKDTVVVTPTGCRIIGWYKDWREPYIPIASI